MKKHCSNLLQHFVISQKYQFLNKFSIILIKSCWFWFSPFFLRVGYSKIKLGKPSGLTLWLSGSCLFWESTKYKIDDEKDTATNHWYWNITLKFLLLVFKSYLKSCVYISSQRASLKPILTHMIFTFGFTHLVRTQNFPNK